MKKYTQAKIPKGMVELRFRGSREEIGNLSAKLVIPATMVGQILVYASKAPRYKRPRNK